MRSFGKPDLILLAIVDRMIAAGGGYDAASCYMSLDPDVIAPNAGEFVCVVSPTSGNFNSSLIDGGGQAQCGIETGVIVKIHSSVQLDRASEDRLALTDAAVGILERWRLMLKALVCWDPLAPEVGGNEQTRNPLIPQTFAIERGSRGGPQRSRLAIETAFAVDFDIDLS